MIIWPPQRGKAQGPQIPDTARSWCKASPFMPQNHADPTRAGALISHQIPLRQDFKGEQPPAPSVLHGASPLPLPLSTIPPSNSSRNTSGFNYRPPASHEDGICSVPWRQEESRRQKPLHKTEIPGLVCLVSSLHCGLHCLGHLDSKGSLSRTGRQQQWGEILPQVTSFPAIPRCLL